MACSDWPFPHCCNGIDVWRHTPQTAKSDRVNAPGGKPLTRPLQVENLTLSGADNGDNGRPTGLLSPPMDPPIGGWPYEWSREDRVRQAAQPRYLSYAAAL